MRGTTISIGPKDSGSHDGRRGIALISLYGTENAGLRILAALLKRRGYRAPLILFKTWMNNRVEPPRRIEKDILVSILRKEGVDACGISFGASAFVRIARDLAEYIKENLGIAVITGGVHATLAPQECITFSDVVCVGEGEGPLLEWAEMGDCREIESPRDGLWIKGGDGKVLSGRPWIYGGNLDELPPPHIVDPPIYYIERGKVIDRDPMLSRSSYKVYTSRGCPYNCSFCFNSAFHRFYGRRGYYRIRGVESVIRELVEAREKLPGIRMIRFDDDVFVVKRGWLEEFIPLYKKEVGLPFECLLNPGGIDEDLIFKLRSAGLERVEIGIQGGTKQMVEGIYQRSFLNRTVMSLAPLFKKHGIAVNYDIIVDNPLSGIGDREELLDFLRSLPKPYQLTQFSLTFFPCTDLTESLLNSKMLSLRDVEGANDKTLRQFLVTLDYPRSMVETHYICMNSLASKWFIPDRFISLMRRLDPIETNPSILVFITKWANVVALLSRGVKSMIQGRLNAGEIEEYGGLTNLILN